MSRSEKCHNVWEIGDQRGGGEPVGDAEGNRRARNAAGGKNATKYGRQASGRGRSRWGVSGNWAARTSRAARMPQCMGDRRPTGGSVRVLAENARQGTSCSASMTRYMGDRRLTGAKPPGIAGGKRRARTPRAGKMPQCMGDRRLAGAKPSRMLAGNARQKHRVRQV